MGNGIKCVWRTKYLVKISINTKKLPLNHSQNIETGLSLLQTGMNLCNDNVLLSDVIHSKLEFVFRFRGLKGSALAQLY